MPPQYETKGDGWKEKANVLSDIKLRDNVTITIVPNLKGKGEGEVFGPFKRNKRLQRSPIVSGSGKMEAEAGVELEGGDVMFGVGDNDQSTPIATRNAKGGKYLARRAFE